MNNIRNKIIAHRGESYDAPENSLSAINLAWQRGAKAVEIDIHLTLDNEIVVIHDNHTGRVGHEKLVIKRTDLAKIKSIDIGRKKSEEYIGERVPTLPEVLATVRPGAKLIIEIKCGREIISPLIKILQSSKLDYTQIEIIAFNFKVISEVKERAPQYKALWLLDLDYYLPHWLVRAKPKNIIKDVTSSSLDGINVWAGKMIDLSFVNPFKKEGLFVYVWTVNDPQVAQRMFGYGVDAITTDRAAWLTKQLVIKN